MHLNTQVIFYILRNYQAVKYGYIERMSNDLKYLKLIWSVDGL